MIGVASLLTVLTLGLLITRVATVALRVTGLSHDEAHFQARSAFSGVGFTTAESEDIVNHPARRRIVLIRSLHGDCRFSPAFELHARPGFLSHPPGRAETRNARGAEKLSALNREPQRSAPPGRWNLPASAGSGRQAHDAVRRRGGDRPGVDLRSPAHRGAAEPDGRSTALEELEARRAGTAGDLAHLEAAAEQRRIVEAEAPERWQMGRLGPPHHQRHRHARRSRR